jgi:hypothetical protein
MLSSPLRIICGLLLFAGTGKPLSPGAYTILAWDDIEPGAYQNPEFLKEVEDRGVKASVERGSRIYVTVRSQSAKN